MLKNALPDSNVRDRLIIVRDSSLTVDAYANQFAVSGYVVDTVPFAILAAIHASDFRNTPQSPLGSTKKLGRSLGLPSTFEKTIQQLVQFGGDTDTVASMFGQIYGAAHGTKSLPQESINLIDAATLVRDNAFSLSQTTVVK